MNQFVKISDVSGTAFKKVRRAYLLLLFATLSLVFVWGFLIYYIVRGEIFTQVENQVSRLVNRANTQGDLLGLQNELGTISVPFGRRFPTQVRVSLLSPPRLIAQYSTAEETNGLFAVGVIKTIENKFLGSLSLEIHTNFSPLVNILLLGILILAFFLGFAVVASERFSGKFLRDYLRGFDEVLDNIRQEKTFFDSISVGQSAPEARELSTFMRSLELKTRKLLDENTILQAGRERAEIAKRVAHDIRSPLAALKTATSLLNESDSAEIKELLNKSADRINRIAQELLEETRQQKVLGKYDYSELGSLIRGLVQEKSVNPHLSIKVNMQEFRSRKIIFEPTQLERIISNLLNNALESGATEISIIVDSKEDLSIDIEIIDNGPGFPEAIMKTQGRTQISTKSGGHGLGLSSACEMIKTWGATLDLRNSSDGAIVKIRLISS